MPPKTEEGLERPVEFVKLGVGERLDQGDHPLERKAGTGGLLLLDRLGEQRVHGDAKHTCDSPEHVHGGGQLSPLDPADGLVSRSDPLGQLALCQPRPEPLLSDATTYVGFGRSAGHPLTVARRSPSSQDVEVDDQT